jgi:hypothetical protein
MISAAKRFTIAALLIAGLLAAIEPAGAQIVAIGASNVAGRGVSTPEAWPAQLEGMLAGKGRSVHVTNAGISGDTNAGTLARLGSSCRTGPRSWGRVERQEKRPGRTEGRIGRNRKPASQTEHQSNSDVVESGAARVFHARGARLVASKMLPPSRALLDDGLRLARKNGKPP